MEVEGTLPQSDSATDTEISRMQILDLPPYNQGVGNKESKDPITS